MKILVGVDGSGQSRAAVRAAHDLAVSLHASLELAYVVSGGLLDRDEAEAARARLEALALEHAVDGTPAAVALLNGSPAETLARYAAITGADLLAVGSRGDGTFRDVLGNGAAGDVLGLTTAQLLRVCRKPVLVVKRDGRPPCGGMVVLAGVDGSVEAAAAVRLAATIARATSAGLRVACVMPERFPYAEAVGCSALRTAENAHGAEVVHFEKLPLHGIAAVALAEAASRPDVAMLVIGNCSHRRIATGPRGSTADTLVRICAVPVLVAA